MNWARQQLTAVPERIVVLEYSFADHLAMLDTAPVGYAVDAMPDYLLPFTEGVGAEPVGTRAEPSLEAIVALRPDLIIGDLRRHEAIYDQLSEIAPDCYLQQFARQLSGSIRYLCCQLARFWVKRKRPMPSWTAYQQSFAETAAETT